VQSLLVVRLITIYPPNIVTAINIVIVIINPQAIITIRTPPQQITQTPPLSSPPFVLRGEIIIINTVDEVALKFSIVVILST
jgi:hypothetical protein